MVRGSGGSPIFFVPIRFVQHSKPSHPFYPKKKKGNSMNIFGDRSRFEHFIVGMGLGLVFTILCVLGAMSAAEFKDWKHGGKWDWSDWGWGMVGGLIGQSVQLLIIYAIWK